MTLKHLRIFKEVCDLESITLASDKLNIAQPTVSIFIKELEAFYGVRLFDRMNRRLYITDEGKLLRQYADTIIQQFNEAENVIRKSDYISTLRIGSNVSIGMSLLPMILKDFQKQNQNVMTTSSINNSGYIEKQLLQNELDLAMIDHHSDCHNFHAEFLYEEQMIAVCSKKYAKHLGNNISLKTLSTERILLREKGSGSRDIIDMVFKLNNLIPNIYIESISTNALIQAVLHDLGILFLPKQLLAMKDYGDLLTQININDTEFKRKYSIIYNRSKYLTPNMKEFMRVSHIIAKKLEKRNFSF